MTESNSRETTDGVIDESMILRSVDWKLRAVAFLSGIPTNSAHENVFRLRVAARLTEIAGFTSDPAETGRRGIQTKTMKELLALARSRGDKTAEDTIRAKATEIGIALI